LKGCSIHASFALLSVPKTFNKIKNKIITHFYVKKEKKDNKREVPIYLRITVNGERAEITTNRRVNPEIWDNRKKSDKI
jgi:hypothetical protein